MSQHNNNLQHMQYLEIEGSLEPDQLRRQSVQNSGNAENFNMI